MNELVSPLAFHWFLTLVTGVVAVRGSCSTS